MDRSDYRSIFGSSPMNSPQLPTSASQSFQEDDTVMLLRGPSNQYGQRQSLALGSVVSEANESRFLNESDFTVLPGEISRYAGDGTISNYGNSEPLEALHEQFHEILELNKRQRSSFELVKDFISICVSFMQSQPQDSDREQWLCDEKDTWRLLHILMEDRLNYEYVEDDMAMTEFDIPVSEKEIMLEVFRKDPVTRQSQLVVDWLEACEAGKRAHHQTLRAEHFTDRTVSWENTILQIRQKDEIAYSSNTQLVTEIDPDAPVRQGRPIHKLDAEDEVLLLSQILSHIRCGQLEQAQKLCIHCGQPWRAATLEGWRLYHNPNIAKGGDENKKEGYVLPTEGNPNRDVWKLAAWRMAEDQRMPSCARTTYAALCGNLEAMLLNMDTWHDWLWAYVRTMIDVRIEEEIRDKSTRNYVDMPNKYWANKITLTQIFASLASSPVAQVRLEHAKELTSVQRFLILDDMNSLYATLSSWSRQITDFRNPLSALLIRFSAHLVLVLRSMGKEVTESCNNHGNEVLRVYAKFIVTLGNPNLIMSYVAKLPKEDQVATLAQYLESVTDIEKKAQCLELAGREGLDAEAAAQSVVESIRARELKRSSGDLLRGEATEEDLAKIEALDWLVVYPSQYSEALWQANALVRQFIASGKLDAARAAFAKLPSQTINVILQDQLKEYPDIDDLDATMSPRHRSAVREHLSLKLYLDAHQEFSKWFKFFHQQRPSEPESLPREATFQQKLVHEERVKQYQASVKQWRKNLSCLSTNTKTRLFNILTFPDGGWLGCGEDLDDDSAETVGRRRELEGLCKLCIPEAALLIHEVSVLSGEPQGSMHLADVLASERYALYRVFSKEKLRELLAKISEACIELLKMSKDPWGHTVTS